MGGEQPFPSGFLQDWFATHVFVPLYGWQFLPAVIATVVLFFLILAGMQRLGSAGRRRLTVVCTFVAGLFYMISFFWPAKSNPVKAYETPLGMFLLVMGGFTIGLGVLNLVAVHGKVLLHRRPGVLNSLGFFGGFIGMTVFGLWQMRYQVDPAATQIPLAVAGYRLFFEGLLTALQSTTFALLGFFIVSAAYRAFRIQNTEAALMTVIAFVVMLGSVPLGQAITGPLISVDSPYAFLRMENITFWLLTQPNAAAFRGILFGAATGSFALAMRVWLSLERGAYLGKEF